jgi:putative phage-type endonuclease
MKIINVVQNSAEWDEIRKGKITGSKLNDIVVKRGTGKKIGFYELIADRVATQPDGEDPMERGHRLEDEALDLYEKQVGKLQRGVFAISDDNPNMAISHDAINKKHTHAVEVKCLSSAKHLQAYFEQQIPSEYEFQRLQYFIINPELQQLDFVFYDPRVTCKQLHSISFFRKDLEEEIEQYKQYQIDILAEVDKLVEELVF